MAVSARRPWCRTVPRLLLLLAHLCCVVSPSTSARKPRRLGRRIFLALRGFRGGEASSSPLTLTTEYSLRENATDDDMEEDSDSRALFKSLWGRLVPKWESTEFLDRIALVAASVLQRENSSLAEEEHLAVYNETFLQEITPQSDLTRPGRFFHIVTTAALPWFTGTAVNPLLRAAYLHRRTQEINNATSTETTVPRQSWVTLVIPWLELREDQELLYGQVFVNTSEQEAFIRSWLSNEAAMPDVANDLDIIFYPARYHSGLRSIFAMGDMMDQLDPDKMDVAILEEPEHVNWFRAPGDGWTEKFPFVVGIIHTNYKEYAASHYSGLFSAPALAMISSAMVRAYCHRVVKLSDTLPPYAPEKECTANVHGVRSEFIVEGIRRAEATCENGPLGANATKKHGKSPYYIGKLLWAKGLEKLLELEEAYRTLTGEYFPIDIYGSGPEEAEIKKAFHGRQTARKRGNAGARGLTKRGIQELAQLQLAKLKDTLPRRAFAEFKDPVPANFPGRVDHATLKEYTVFINPSLSEVLCTTTFEALAMGKFVIIPDHPSNRWFQRFPNALFYRDGLDFVASVRWALYHDPEPLTEDQIKEFTWEAATDRLIRAASITHNEALERERLALRKLDERIAWFHNELGKGVTGDWLRKLCGAGPASDQVKYQMERALASPLDGGDDESDGLSEKFRRSTFVEAIRRTLGDISNFGIQ